MCSSDLAARFFQTTFEPVGRVCAARHARGGLRLQRKWRTRAYRTHLHASYGLLPPRGREQVAADFAVAGGLKMGCATGGLGC